MNYLGISVRDIIAYRLRTYLMIAVYYLRYMLPNIRIMHKTRSLKGTKKGSRAFVFANGPSMKKLDPYKVLSFKKKGFDIFGVNSYINTEFANIVSPEFYVFSDPAHFGVNVHLLTDQRKREVIKDMEKIGKCGAKLFVPVEYYDRVDYDNSFAFCDAENIFSSNVSNITRPRGYLSMTAYKALAIACYLGYDAIYICGFDNNYFKTLTVDHANMRYYSDEHFYDVKNSSQLRYKVRDNEGKDVGELLYSHHFLFKDLTKFKNFRMTNLDKDSLVDCFPKQHDLDVYL